VNPALNVDEGHILGGRFRATRLLKKGQGIETWLGVDLHRQKQVVIKMASSGQVSNQLRIRLEHEAQILQKIQSPHISPLLYGGNQEAALFFVMPFLPGTTLAERLREAPFSVREALAVGRSLLSALHEVHTRGILHRDVKPSNIMVDGAPVTRAILIDFGFARSESLQTAIRDLPVGTVRYVSPEQAGLIDVKVSECADLYSAGMVLYECLAGRPPFKGTDVGELLQLHLNVRPMELRDLGISVPRALDEVIQRLLRKDPSDRYQTAEGALADLSQISDAIDRGISEPAVVIGLQDRRRTLAAPAFIGRDEELSILERELERAKEGEGRLVFLEGESGIGKSRLLKEFERRALRQGAWVLQGQGVDQAAQRPFQLLDGIVQGLLAAARWEPEVAKTIRRRLGAEMDAVSVALPDLKEAFGTQAQISLGLEEHGEIRNLRALTSLLDSLGSETRPAVILLDDGQWADELTLKLLDRWSRRTDSEGKAGRHILLILSFRSEEVSADHSLRRLSASVRLRLAPFDPTDVARMAESMAGPLPQRATEVVAQLSEGNSFMAAAVLQGLVECGALVNEPSGWRIESDRMAEVQASRRAAIFLTRRLERLTPEALRLLSVGAVLGKEFDLAFAGSLAGLTSQEASSVVDEGRNRHILWVDMAEARCHFVHDKIREALLGRIPQEERKHLHLQAAQQIESVDPGRIFELAYHFDAAGQSDRALPYALAAAERARAQHALETAERQYRIAERGVQQADEATRKRVAEGLGDVLMLRGGYDKAKGAFEAARALAKEKIDQAQIEGKLGELAFKRGDMEAATEAIERGLGLMGKLIPKRFGSFVVFALWEILIQALHGCLPGLFLARRPLAKGKADLLAVRLYSRLGYAYWFCRGTIPTLWTHLRELNLAERYPASREMGQAYSNHNIVMTTIPYLSRAIRYAERGLTIRKELGDLWGQGQSLHFFGFALLTASRFSEAIEASREAIKLLERTGDQWEVSNAIENIANSLYRMGDLKGSVEEYQRLFQTADEIGDIECRAASLRGWSVASGGNGPFILIKAGLQSSEKSAQATVELMQSEAMSLLRKGSASAAVAILQVAQKLIVEKDLSNDMVAPISIWLVTALRREVEQVKPYAVQLCRQKLNEIDRTARRSLRIAKRFRNNLPHMLRELGFLAAMQGRAGQARKYFDESLAVGEELGMRFEQAQTFLARGHVGLHAGWPRAAEEVASAEQELRALGAEWVLEEYRNGKTVEKPVTLSLADRFDALLEEGRKIASALAEEAVFTAVRTAALRLLRGERCLILKIAHRTGEPILQVVAGEEKEDYSRTVVARALESGRPVVIAEGVSEDVSDSVLLSEARSILAAPIFARGRAVGCIYMTHQRVGRLFGEEEIRLASFIATLAGAALENAEGFAKLEALTKSLEERVEERTASLKAGNQVLESEIAERKRIESQLERMQEQLRSLSLRSQSTLEEERSRIAREIHDEFGQTLTVLKMQLSFLERRFRGGQTPISEWTKSMSEMIDTTIERVRQVASELRPIVLDDLGLPAAIEWQAKEFQERTGITCRCFLQEEIAIDRMHLTAVFRVFQEALTNVARHSGASDVEIKLNEEKGAAFLQVRDNGRGITEEQRLHQKSLGLIGMRERARACGGEVGIEGIPGKGTTITVRVPL
jgi:signal transduction histidine kinase/tetratricopeptide (TPR) repeat protein/tRNA A-37 threonylcarbamoyl transferase component Bud32